MKNLMMLFVAAMVLVPGIGLADTIFLKNGKQIKDVEAVEDGSFVKYYRGGQEISVPKGNVERIERIELPKPRIVAEEDKTDDHVEEPNLDANPDLSNCVKVKEWEKKIVRYRVYLRKVHADLALKKIQNQQNKTQDTPEAAEVEEKLKKNEADIKLADSLDKDLDVKKAAMGCKD